MPVQAVLQPKNGITKKINDLLNQDAQYTVRDLARLANFSLARVYVISRNHLKPRKINARCIP